MATYIEMPKLADTMTEGTLIKWRKAVGDKVQAGDIIAEVETDKATMEMEAFDDGILHEYLVKEGQKVPIGTKIALLLAKGEKAPAPGAAPAAAPAPKAEAQPQPAGAPAGTAQAAQPGYGAPAAAAPTPVPSTSGERVKSSPLARKIAQSKGVDISTIQGTGPGGRIVARDVESGASVTAPAAAAGYGKPSAAGATSVPAAPAATAGAGDKQIPLTGMRRVVPQHHRAAVFEFFMLQRFTRASSHHGSAPMRTVRQPSSSPASTAGAACRADGWSLRPVAAI